MSVGTIGVGLLLALVFAAGTEFADGLAVRRARGGRRGERGGAAATRAPVSRVRIAVAGAGLIGRRHVEEVGASADAELAAVIDPGPAGPELAAKHGVACFPSLAALFAADRPDGIVLATPNRMHVDGGLECIAAGVPVIVEKPLGDTVASARRLVDAGERAGIAVLTGHHRNYSPIMAKAREIVASGVLGRVVAVTGTALFHKPDDYFEVGDGWRRKPGGGPVLLNLTHEVNSLLSLCGDIVSVAAVTSDAARGFAVEDTAAMVFTFTNGALGTFVLSDAAASARSWEQTSQENASTRPIPTRTRTTSRAPPVRCRCRRCG